MMADGAADSKWGVAEIRRWCATGFANEDVGRLESAMHNAVRMRERERLGHRQQERDHSSSVECMNLRVCADVEPIDEVHHEIGVALLECACRTEIDKRWMGDRAHDAPLATHAVDAALAEPTQFDRFHRDATPPTLFPAEVDVA